LPYSSSSEQFPTALPLSWLNRKHGLPSGQVHAACQDQGGLLWLAGPSGLTCWDGARARVLSKPDGLRTQGLRSVACAPSGELWIGSDLGVDVLDQTRPEGDQIRHLSPQGWPHGWVSHIVFDDLGGAWLGCARGLLYWTPGGGFVRQEGLELDGPGSDGQSSDGPHSNGPGLGDSMISALILDLAGRVWVAGPRVGLLRRQDGQFRAPEQQGWQRAGVITCLGVAARGHVLIGGTAGLVVTDSQGAQVGGTERWHAGPITALLCTGEELWVGSGAGLQRRRQEAQTWVHSADLLPGVAVNALLNDSQGNLWVATDHAGVARLSGLRASMTQYQPGGSVLSARQGPAGEVWLGGTHGSFSLDLQSGAAHPMPGLEHLQVWDLLDHAGTVWAATQQGLYRKVGGRFEHVAPQRAELAQPCRALLARPGALWLGTIHGLYVLSTADPEAAPRELLGGGSSLGYVYTLETDTEGRALVGTLGRGLWRSYGLGHSDGGPGSLGEQLEQLSSGPLVAGGHVYAVAPHPSGQLAVLQDHQTLLLGPEGEARVLDTSAEGVAGWSARWVEDHLWVGGAAGLREYAPDGQLSSEVQAWIGPEAWEFTTSRSLLPLPGGRLLCGLNSGAVLLDPRKLRHLPVLPPLRCTGLRWSGGAPGTQASREGAALLSIATGNWSLEVDLACPWFLEDDDLRFRHRLLGFERDWSAWSAATTLHFTSLPPGEYSLEVQATSLLRGAGEVARLLTLQVRAASAGTRLGRLWSDLISARSNRSLLAQNLLLEQRVRERTLSAERANARLLELNEELLALSSTDALTGLPNRRAFDEALRQELRRAARQNTPLSVALLDIDEFKSYNDVLGHVQGDACLRQVAQIMQAAVRLGLDTVARYGGEEFVMVLPGTDTAGAVRAVERLRSALALAAIPHPGSSVARHVTLSAGVASSGSGTPHGPETMLERADRALYRAKHQGRNQAAADPLEPLAESGTPAQLLTS
jgi:diguanylate cyclase (GGDEF)-like protein